MCGNTKAIMERSEGHPLPLVDGSQVVPFGVVRLVELQEAGWSYMRP
jgi:intracellular sulfur oxidation DsrE/DsrF family protein